MEATSQAVLQDEHETPPSSPLPLRLLTVNTHKGFSFFNRRFILHELREAVRTISADIVFLQEVLGSHSRHANRHADWPVSPQYEFLADSIWGQFAYGRNAVYPWGDHGNALLSKYPIVRYQNLDVSVAGPEKRGLLHCVIDIPAQLHGGEPLQVHAVCVHLGLQEAHRKRQTALLCDLVRTEVPDDAPLFIAGDFNDWRFQSHRLLDACAGLKEVNVARHGRAARTFPARWPLLSLDRIYVRNVRSHKPLALGRRPWAHLSDHAPLAAEVHLW